jgi:hypothetical protein
LYIADIRNKRIRVIDIATNGETSRIWTLAGNGLDKHHDGYGSDAAFRVRIFALNLEFDMYLSLCGLVCYDNRKCPSHICLEPDGCLIVSDMSTIRRITPEGLVMTIAGSYPSGETDGDGLMATFGSFLGSCICDTIGNMLADSAFPSHSIQQTTLQLD